MESKFDCDKPDSYQLKKSSKDSDSPRDTYLEDKPQSEAKSVSSLSSSNRERKDSSFKEEKLQQVERELDEEVDLEFQNLLKTPNTGTIAISNDPLAKKILSGFKINWMKMKDGETNKPIWSSSNWGNEMFDKEIEENISKDILRCKIVAREINFSSRELIENFRIEQRVYFAGQCIEEWFFKFGFVIPGSTNTWEQSITAASPDQMMKAEVLSGNVTFETSFYSNDLFICKNLVRIFYF